MSRSLKGFEDLSIREVIEGFPVAVNLNCNGEAKISINQIRRGGSDRKKHGVYGKLKEDPSSLSGETIDDIWEKMRLQRMGKTIACEAVRGIL